MSMTAENGAMDVRDNRFYKEKNMSEEKQPDFIKIPGLAFEIAPHDEGPMTWYEAMKPRNDGWRVPTADELHQMYLHKAEIPNLTESWYWSSTEYGLTYSWIERFSYGSQIFNLKTNASGVRCVRDERFNRSVISPAEKPDGGAAGSMTKREIYAMSVLQGFCSGSEWANDEDAEIAKTCFRMADAMIKAGEKK